MFIPKGGKTLAEADFNGYVAGAGFNFPLTENGRFSIQPEILFLQKGVNEKIFLTVSDPNNPNTGAPTSIRLTNKTRIDYLELPLLAKITFGDKILRGSFTAGPAVAYSLGGRTSFTVASGGTLVTEEGKVRFGAKPLFADIYDQYLDKRVDVSVQFGGGIGLHLGPGSLQLEARYGWGLTQLVKEQGSQTNASQYRNRVLALSLGYAIPLGGK